MMSIIGENNPTICGEPTGIDSLTFNAETKIASETIANINENERPSFDEVSCFPVGDMDDVESSTFNVPEQPISQKIYKRQKHSK